MTSLFDLDENSSDSEDDIDYVPEGNVSDVSASEGDASDDESPQDSKTKKKSRKKQNKSSVEPEETSKITTPEVTKAKADDIWKSFLEEVDQTPLNKIETLSETSSPTVSSSAENITDVKSTLNASCNNSHKKSPSDVLEFAGETLSVSEDGSVVDVLSSQKTVTSLETNSSNNKAINTAPVKRKGLQSVLGTIMNKKQKINTLQKSLIDWKSYKKDEGIEEDLQTFNRGKGGYIERQRFLERSTIRSYEVERDVRLSKAKK